MKGHNGWVKTTLGKVVNTNVSSIGRNFGFKEIYYLDTGSIAKGEIEALQKLNLKDAPSRAKRLVQDQDIIYSTVRPNQKHFGFLNNPKENLVVSTGFTVITAIKEKANAKFLYFFLTQDRITNELQQIAEHSVSTYPSIKPENLEGLEINLPPLSQQHAIASILTSFNDKIELLRNQNKTLEAMAQTIFKEWFVDFRFPGAGKMVDSELGMIPEGWRVFELSELVKIINGYSYKGTELVKESNKALVTLKSFDRNGGFQARGFKPFCGKPKNDQEVQIGDLVVAHTDLTQDAEVLGNPAYIFDKAGFEKMYITMDLVKVVTQNRKVSNAFLYYLMRSHKFKRHCVGYANGTTVLHMSKKAIPEYRIALPNDLTVVFQFSEVSRRITEKISNNLKQINSLSQIRDNLLPKLMSGELRVKI